MAQARVKVKLEGFKMEVGAFEVEIIGERAEVPQLKAAAMDHVRNLLTPSTAIVETSAQRALPLEGLATPPERPATSTPNRSGRRSNSASRANRSGAEGVPLDWKPDTQRWGTPSIKWSNFEKGAWLMYCYAQEVGDKGLPAPVVAATFNKHYPQAKLIQLRYLERDLTRSTQGEEPKVAEDPSQNPALWHLTEFGRALVKQLIAGGKSQGASVGSP